MVNCLTKQISEECAGGGEPDDAPLGIEPGMAAEKCPACGGPCLDLGIENEDLILHKRKWLKCVSPSCGQQNSIILGPPGEPRKKSDYSELKRRGLI